MDVIYSKDNWLCISHYKFSRVKNLLMLKGTDNETSCDKILNTS